MYIVIYFEKHVYKIIFAIFLFFATNLHAESGYNIADEISSNTSNQLIFETFTEIDSELEFDLSITNIDHHNRIIQFTYLSTNSHNNFPILKNKFQYLCPRAPPLFII